MLNFGNKEFRNLQEQVLENAKNIEILKGRPLLEIQIVEELPEEGVGGVLYLVPAEDGDEGNLYEEYVWIDGEWEQVGSTEIDLSAYPTLAGDNEFSGENTFSDTTHFAGIETNNITPTTGNAYDIGADGKYFKEAKINKVTVATSGYDITKDGSNLKLQADGNAIIFRGNVEPTVDGTYALGKSNVRWTTVNASSIANDYSALSIKGKSGVNFQCDNGSEVRPSTDAQITLGGSSSRWKTLYLSHYVSWGSNVLIGKDSSNRFYVTDSAGNTKLKIGTNETLSANKLSPDTSNSTDLGRSGLRWNYAYVNYLVASDDTVINTSDLARNTESLDNDDLWYSGNLGKTTGQATIDISDEGVGTPPNGVYFFIYGNAQAMFYLNATTIQNAAYYPIRVACPVLIKDGGGAVSGATGNLKIERSGTTLTITVASTISGAARTEYASDTQGWGFYIYHTGL